MLDIEVKRVNGAYQLRDKTTGAWFGMHVRPDEVEKAKRTCKGIVPFVGKPGEGVLVPLRYGNTAEAAQKRRLFERETWETLAPSGVFPYDERRLDGIEGLLPEHQLLFRQYAEASDFADAAEWERDDETCRFWGREAFHYGLALNEVGVWPQRYKTGHYEVVVSMAYVRRRHE